MFHYGIGLRSGGMDRLVKCFQCGNFFIFDYYDCDLYWDHTHCKRCDDLLVPCDECGGTYFWSGRESENWDTGAHYVRLRCPDCGDRYWKEVP